MDRLGSPKGWRTPIWTLDVQRLKALAVVTELDRDSAFILGDHCPAVTSSTAFSGDHIFWGLSPLLGPHCIPSHQEASHQGLDTALDIGDGLGNSIP
jgi:hypothetical protein